jgi:hypothetical protein
VLRLLTLAAVLSSPEWGSVLVPSTFRPAPDLPLLGTGAAAPGLPEAPGRALAFFVEATTADAGSDTPLVAISEVSSPLPEENSLRDTVFSSTVAHFHQDLDLEAHVDRPIARGDHVEVSAEIARSHANQTVRLGFFPAGTRHFVIWASYPSARAGELTPVLDALFDSYRPPGSVSPGVRTSGNWRLGAIVVAGAIIAFATRVLRRRRLSAEAAGGHQPPSGSVEG